MARGVYRDLVTFEAPTRIADGEGGYLETWAPLTPATWFVSIRPATARDAERATAGTIVTHVSHLIEGDYHPGVTTAARMRDAAGRVYQVTSAIDRDNRGRTMELIADLQS
jgi:head-tail adaptor